MQFLYLYEGIYSHRIFRPSLRSTIGHVTSVNTDSQVTSITSTHLTSALPCL